MGSEPGREASLLALLEQARQAREQNPAGYLAMATALHAQRSDLPPDPAMEVELLLADALLQAGQHEEALRHCHRLQQGLDEGLFPEHFRHRILHCCICCHEASGQYEQAMDARLQLMAHASELEPEQQVDNLLGMATFHNRVQSADKALNLLDQAHDLHIQYGLSSRLAGRIESERAQAWLLNGDLDRALTCMETALAFWDQLGLLRERGEDLARLAAIQHARGESHPALETLQQAMLMLEAAGCEHRLPAIHLQAARIHADLKQTDESLFQATTALEMARKSGDRECSAGCHGLLVQLYETLGHHRQALEHLRQQYRLEQSLYSERTRRRLLQLELDHALQKSEKEKALYRLKSAQLTQALQEAERLRIRLEHQAHRDQLTQLYNRHYLVDKLNTSFRRSRRNDRPLTLVLADLDHFKRINDRYSHAIGDQVLIQVAELLRSNLRQSDVAGRYGGEEFLLILPDTDEQAAFRVCEKLRRCIHGYPWERIAPGLKVTISMGICAQAQASSHEELLQMADRFLYAAKASGRNRIVSRSDQI